MDDDSTDDSTDGERLELERLPMIEEVLDAIGNQKRLATLEKVTHGVPASDIHEQVDASRSGVNRFLTDMRDVDLLEDTDDGLVLTRKGRVVVEKLNELDDVFEEFEKERLQELIDESSLSQEEIAQLVESRREDTS